MKIDALYNNSSLSSFWLTNITLVHANNTWVTQSAMGECSNVNFSNQRQTGETMSPSRLTEARRCDVRAAVINTVVY